VHAPKRLVSGTTTRGLAESGGGADVVTVPGVADIDTVPPAVDDCGSGGTVPSGVGDAPGEAPGGEVIVGDGAEVGDPAGVPGLPVGRAVDRARARGRAVAVPPTATPASATSVGAGDAPAAA
jgi:hypothetical protein